MAHVPKPITEKYLRWHVENYLKRYFTSTVHLKRLLMRRVRKSAEYWGSDSRSREQTDARIALERERGWTGKSRFKAGGYGDDDVVTFDRSARPKSGFGKSSFGKSSFGKKNGKESKKKKGMAYEEVEESRPAPRSWLVGASPTQLPNPKPITAPSPIPALNPVPPQANPPPAVPPPKSGGLSAYARQGAPATSLWGEVATPEDDLWNLDTDPVASEPSAPAYGSGLPRVVSAVGTQTPPAVAAPEEDLEDPGAEDEPPESLFDGDPVAPQRGARTMSELIEEGSNMIDKVIAEAEQTGQLNDDRFAASKIRTMARRGISARGIAARLSAKGLTGEQVEAGMNDLKAELGGDPEVASAAALVRKKKLGPYRPAATRRDNWQRDLGVLARAGFSFDLARRLLATDSPEALDELVEESTPPR